MTDLQEKSQNSDEIQKLCEEVLEAAPMLAEHLLASISLAEEVLALQAREQRLREALEYIVELDSDPDYSREWHKMKQAARAALEKPK